MGKRKRNTAPGNEELPFSAAEVKKQKVVLEGGATPVTIQIIIGTYDKVLHGITASIKSHVKEHPEQDLVEFADTFLLNAHTSAIRCLAVRILLSNLFLSVSNPGCKAWIDSFRASCMPHIALALT